MSTTIVEYMDRPAWHERVNGALMGVMSSQAFTAGCLAALSDDRLRQCTAESLGSAFLKCASLGLHPGPQQLVSLIPRRGEVTVMLGWRGIACLFQRLPHVLDVTAVLVHIDDPFSIDAAGQVQHQRDPFDREVTSPDNCRGGYLRIEHTDGRVKYHVTSVRKINENKQAAGNSSVWRTYFAPMALKTIYRDAWARAAVSFEPSGPQAQHILAAELHEREVNDESPARVNAPQAATSPATAAISYTEP